MQQPIIPQKPPSNQAQTADLQMSPSIDKQEISYENLDYPLIPPNTAAERLSFEPKQPQYFHELSSAKLCELLNDYEVLKGLVLSKYSNAYESLGKNILETLNKQINYVKELIMNYETKVLAEVDNLNEKLTGQNVDLENFNHLQVLMYDKMNSVSKVAVIDTLRQNMKSSDDKCLKLVNDARGKAGGLDSNELDQFIEQYKNQRQVYYLKKEKLARVLQERVGGLD